MRKGIFAALAGLIAVGITVVLLANASTSANRCGPVGSHGATVNTLIPPGNSSVSEYVENVPTARGGCPDLGLISATRAGMIPRSTQHALLAGGRVGAATEALARATGPAGSVLNVPGLPGAISNRRAGAGTTGATGSGGGSSPLVAIADGLGGSSGGGGLGALFPIVLIVCVLGIGAAFLIRLRRRES